MKLITKFKSPNCDYRRSNRISYIIIHYTALNNCTEAINFLCNPKKKVSSHYVISKKGEIYNLVSEKKRAWHAGISFWKGKQDINSNSIGIELDFNPKTDRRFSNKMIYSLIHLILKLMKKYNIKKENVLGHSDIAPYRKVDPGKKFPWLKLNKNKASLIIKRTKNRDSIKVENLFKNLKITKKKDQVLFMLKSIGYETKPARLTNSNFKKLIKCYQMHFVKKAIFGNLDGLTYKTIKAHFNLFLTIK